IGSLLQAPAPFIRGAIVAGCGAASAVAGNAAGLDVGGSALVGFIVGTAVAQRGSEYVPRACLSAAIPLLAYLVSWLASDTVSKLLTGEPPSPEMATLISRTVSEAAMVATTAVVAVPDSFE